MTNVIIEENRNTSKNRPFNPTTSQTYTYKDLYQLKTITGNSSSYLYRAEDGVYQRNYRWNERNLLRESSDSVYTVQYRYGSDGQRAIKYVMNNQSTTLYYNNMWQESNSTKDWMVSKHVYVGEDRIATKNNYKANDNTMAEERRTYYYHSDHLGSAQTVTNHDGLIHERLEYTPYGELWIDWKNPNLPGDNTPFRFTGKEMDQETGLYYYGARYLDPKTSRWLSGDPAMYQGDYIPSAPVNDEARKRNGNLPGQGGVYNTVNLHVYHYAGNNPVKYVDPTGRDAWEVTSTWDESKETEFRNLYTTNAINLANEAQKNNEIIDCADLALAALAETASTMGLKLTFTIWDSSNKKWSDISSSDSKFNNKAEFISHIKKNMGAINLLDDRITHSTSEIKKGDLIMFDLRSDMNPNYGGHTVIMTGIVNASKGIINTVQGHIGSTPTIEHYTINESMYGAMPQYRSFRFDRLFK